jgi:hypothetical protein
MQVRDYKQNHRSIAYGLRRNHFHSWASNIDHDDDYKTGLRLEKTSR